MGNALETIIYELLPITTERGVLSRRLLVAEKLINKAKRLLGNELPITHYPLPITQKSGFPPQVRESRT